MKKIQRRQIAAVAVAVRTGLGGTAALAQGSYPAKTITMIVPAAAGGTTDLAAHGGQAPVIGQSVVVDNKGSGSSIAASLVKRAEADGYTLLMQYSSYRSRPPDQDPHLGAGRLPARGQCAVGAADHRGAVQLPVKTGRTRGLCRATRAS